MKMTNEIKLTPPRGKMRNGKNTILLTAVLLVCVFILVFLIISPSRIKSAASDLGADQLEALALKLQDQHLYSAAADAWLEYVKTASLSPKLLSAIYYRVGKAYEQSGDYERALDAFYRSQTVFANEEIAYDLGLRIKENLERLGKFAALRQELTSSTQVGPDAANEIVAEIGTTRIRRSDLDQLIEQRITSQLDLYRPMMPESDLLRRKEELFRDYATESQRKNFLTQYIAEELLYRKARDEQLQSDPEIRRRLLDGERGILAQALLSRELSRQVKIDDIDLRNYYDAHPDEFLDGTKEPPERKPFNDARTEVYQKLYVEKADQVRNRFLSSLQGQYDVVIHQAQLQKEQGGEEDAGSSP